MGLLYFKRWSIHFTSITGSLEIHFYEWNICEKKRRRQGSTAHDFPVICAHFTSACTYTAWRDVLQVSFPLNEHVSYIFFYYRRLVYNLFSITKRLKKNMFGRKKDIAKKVHKTVTLGCKLLLLKTSLLSTAKCNVNRWNNTRDSA